MGYTCPVCDFADLDEAPISSHEICPCCGTQFGLDDAVVNKADLPECYDRLRQNWIDGGSQWFDPSEHPDE